MTTNTINITEAKVHLSEYARRASAGQRTLVLKHHRPAFVIAPVSNVAAARPKHPGQERGRIHMTPDFDATPIDFTGNPMVIKKNQERETQPHA